MASHDDDTRRNRGDRRAVPADTNRAPATHRDAADKAKASKPSHAAKPADGPDDDARRKPHRKHGWFRRTVIVLLILACVGGATAFGIAAYAILTAPNNGKFDPTVLEQMQQTSFIYDQNDAEVTSVYGSINRINISIAEVPVHVRNAFIAAEDLRFYKHFGIDIIRIFGALWRDIKTLSLSQGASTITQQLVKNNYLTPDKTWTRKIQEAWMAIQLEREYSKDEILEMYLNHSYFGAGAHGVEAASETYFGKTVSELTIAEGASLAAILKSPTNYAPHIEPENNRKRRDLVLSIMRDNDLIDEASYQSAKAEPLQLVAIVEKPTPAGWYVDATIKQSESLLSMSFEEIQSAGLRIYTCLDTQLQSAAEALMTDDTLFPAPSEDGTQPECALAIIGENGQIRAIIGGRKRTIRRGFNRATDMKRQPGSTIKPLAVYAPAIDRFGYTPVSMIEDVPTDFNGYSPSNFGEQYYGWVTLRTALAKSLNVPAVKTLADIGMDTATSFLRKLAIPLDDRDNSYALALGAMTYGVSPVDLAMGYQVFLGGGRVTDRQFVRRIEAWNGDVLYEAQPQMRTAMGAQAAYVVTDMLGTAAKEGTAKRLQDAGVPVAGKTGSINYKSLGNRDAWVAAMSPDYTLAVWMGYDETNDAHYLPGDVNGGTLPTRIAARLLAAAYPDGTTKSFVEPEGVVRERIELYALEADHMAMLAGELAPDSAVVEEVFVPGSEPKLVSDYWMRPEPPSDVSVLPGTNSLPRLTFTSRGEGVEYRIYRQEGGQPPVLLSTGQGAAGAQLYIDDTTALPGHTYSYFVVPVHKAALEAGVSDPQGNPSATLTYQVPSGGWNFWDDWFSRPSEGTAPPDAAATEDPTWENSYPQVEDTPPPWENSEPLPP